MQPPIAKIVPHEIEKHGHVRVDDYFWLRERKHPDVLAYLEAENEYTEEMTASSAELREKLYEEIKGRIPQDDETAPYRRGDYFYFTRYREGLDYAIYCRRHAGGQPFPGKPDDSVTPEEILLDVNEIAVGHDFTSVPKIMVNDSGDIMAYAVDHVGGRIFTIHFKDLKTGEMLEDEIADVTSSMVWAADHRTVFYTRHDPVTLRSFQVYRHVLGTPASDDVLVFQEDDATFRCIVARTSDRKYVLALSDQTVTTEVRYLAADEPAGDFQLFLARERGHEYDIDHLGDHFYVRTNRGGSQNFKLLRTPDPGTDIDGWEEVIPHRDDVLLEGFEPFREHLLLEERRNGLTRLRVQPLDGSPDHEIEFDEPVFQVTSGANYETDTEILRFVYTSLTTPWSTFEYNMRTRERVLLKRDRVLGDFDPALYRSERLWATATDGARVPISLVYRPDLASRDPEHPERRGPLMLYGYGAYGASRDVSFSNSLISLLDRGFVFAIAHVRGGEEMGRSWYENGRQQHKMNSFTDFIHCGEHLVAEGWADPEAIYAKGGSAGGLLMGAVMNLQPDLFKGIVAAVPFVDIVNTMLDETIPLTTGEYDEWGNPNKKEDYEYILSYSPYDNVEAKDYPHLLVMTGLHDTLVHYWEPAKWVAKLRAVKTGDNLLLLKTDMGAGHVGPSGRYERYREVAFEYAFLLDLAENRIKTNDQP